MTATFSRPDPRTGSLTRTPRWFGVLLLVLAAGLLANSAIGPLGADLVDYPISGTLRNQLIGLEVITFSLVVPWCALAGVRAVQGQSDAALLAFGPAAYTLYMFVQYVLGPEYGEYHAVILLHLALLTLSGGLTLCSWTLSRGMALPARPRRREAAYGAALVGLALFVVLRYAGALGASFANTAIPEEFAAARTFYWSIYLLDLGIVVPGTVVGAVALLRGHDLGRRALFAVTGWFALVPPSVAAMAATMLVHDDPNASVPTVVLLSIASLIFGAFAIVVYYPLLAASHSRPPQRTAAPPRSQAAIRGRRRRFRAAYVESRERDEVGA